MVDDKVNFHIMGIVQVFTLSGMVWVPIILVFVLEMVAIYTHRDSLALTTLQSGPFRQVT